MGGAPAPPPAAAVAPGDAEDGGGAKATLRDSPGDLPNGSPEVGAAEVHPLWDSLGNMYNPCYNPSAPSRRASSTILRRHTTTEDTPSTLTSLVSDKKLKSLKAAFEKQSVENMKEETERQNNYNLDMQAQAYSISEAELNKEDKTSDLGVWKGDLLL